MIVEYCYGGGYPPPAVWARLYGDGGVLIPDYGLALLGHRLERDVPRAGRRYDPLRRQWTITPAWADEALRAFRAAFPDGAIITPRGVA